MGLYGTLDICEVLIYNVLHDTSMAQRVRKLILPVAGLGKRLRPLTLRKPKALVRLNGGPLLEYMLKDAAASGIDEVVIIASPQHKTHFASYIKKHGNDFPGIRKIHLRIQKKPMGDGHAVLQAQGIFQNEPIAVRFSDDLIIGGGTTIGSLISFYERYNAPVMLLERVPMKVVSRYGVVEIERSMTHGKELPNGKLHALKSFVEKPARKDAPSNLTFVGAYILTRELFRKLKQHGDKLKSEENDALRIADVFRSSLAQGETIYGWQFTGRRLDCGTLEGFYEAERTLKEHEKKEKKRTGKQTKKRR